MGTSSIKKLTSFIKDFNEELNVLNNRNLLLLLMYLDKKSRTINEIKDIFKSKVGLEMIENYLTDLSRKNFIKTKNDCFTITESGKELLKPIYSSRYDIRSIPKNIIPGYNIVDAILGEGSTSVTFKAERTNYPGYYYAIKVIKPGIYENVDIAKCMSEITTLRSYKDYLVIPSEWETFNYQGIKVYYFVMEYVDGIPLKSFFDENRSIDISVFISNFIEQVGRVLQELEKAGKSHGDLHEANILVVKDAITGKHHFKIIDYIGLASKQSFRKYEHSDFDYFASNLKHIIAHTALTPTGEPDKDIIGEERFLIYKNTLNDKYKSFNDFFVDYNNQDLVPISIRKEISKPPFRIFIFEDYNIEDPEWLEIFEASPNFDTRIKAFGNVILSGPRGCGKTIYLKSLSFIPKLIRKIEDDTHLSHLKDKLPDYRQTFGIFFPCRQGEFKIFSPKLIDFTRPQTVLFIKHIFVLKIIRKTISLLADGYKEKIFKEIPSSEGIKDIVDFLDNHLQQKIIIMGRENIFAELSIIARDIEIGSINMLKDDDKYPPLGVLLNESALIGFFDLIKQSVAELNNTRFYIIFDDVSDPNLSFHGQRILNHLVRANNSRYCLKLSTEKYAYDFSDSDGKKLESPHDYKYIDLADWSDIDKCDDALKKYFQEVVNRQLNTAGYDVDITKLLAKLPYLHTELITLLSERSKKEKGVDKKNDDSSISKADENLKGIDDKIFYAGWDIVCQLSSFSVRVLLQICEIILNELPEKELEAIKSNTDKQIDIKIQNKAITKYSRGEYSNLINLSDIGKNMFDIVRNFGRISRDWLQKDAKEVGRKYEVITIERSDNEELNKEAERILQSLLRHSVFIDRGLTFARTELGLVQKISLHRKFCPALKISYREREHLRLSAASLELFLLQPDKFTSSYIKNDKKQLELF